MKIARLFIASFLLMALLSGCATTRSQWEGRVGNYSYDQAVLELGPPDKMAQLQDGTRVAEWLLYPGWEGADLVVWNGPYVHTIPGDRGPDEYLRLTFDPDGRLTAYRRVAK